MNLKDYLNKQSRKRRLIATADITRGNSLLRSFEKESGKQIENVSFVSLSQLANELFLYFESEKGYQPEYTVIDNKEGAMLLRSVAFENAKSLSYFGDEKMLSIATCEEIYSKLNLVRGNGWNGSEDLANKRVCDIKLLTQKYEERMGVEKLLDSLALIKYLTFKLRELTDAEKEIALCFNAQIAVLKEDLEMLTLCEKKFLLALSRLANGEEEFVEIWEKEASIDAIASQSSKMQFFKGYGSFNEANFVANDIIEKKLPLGDVTVLYTAPSQIDAIESAFTANGLRVSFTSDKNLKNNIYIALARRILAWADSNFSEKALAGVYDSTALKNEYEDEGKTFNAVSGKDYFRHVLDAAKRRDNGFILGWGYERNLQFVAHEKAFITEERIKKALEIHEDLLEIFGENGRLYDGEYAVKPSVVYEKLFSFIWKYKNKSADIKVAKGAFDALKGIVVLEDRKLPLKEVISYIDELLIGLCASESLDEDAAEVALLSGWKNIERKNLYIIGLALKEMQINTTQSPVLSDSEMERWLGEGYKPTVENKTAQASLNIYRTLDLFKGDSITLGYSSFDTVFFTENSPSVFYRDALAYAGKSLSDITEFVYGNPTGGVPGYLPKVSSKSGYKIKLKLKTSNSSIEKLLDCPKKYYYSEIAYIPDNSYTEYNEGEWLNAMHFGSFFHDVAQRYVDAVFIKPAAESYASDVDEAVLLPIIKEEAEKMLAKIPAPSEKQYEYEVGKFTDLCKAFFKKVHDTMLTDDLGWRMLMTEKRFDDEPYQTEDYFGNKYAFHFNGEIDRVDYKVNPQDKKIYFRIADYKTGKYESKSRDDELGKIVQHLIYKKALMGTLLTEVLDKAALLEGNPDIKTYESVFSDFTYYFPKEDKNWKYVIASDEVEGINVTRLKAELTAIKKLSDYPDHVDLYAEISDYAKKHSAIDPKLPGLRDAMTNKNGNLKSEEKYLCKYCDYREICPRSRGGEL